jgi:methionyl-tRNA formyltransferase
LRIAVCTKNDLFGAVVLNHVMPGLAGHDLGIFMSVRDRKAQDDAVPELDLMRLVERQMPLDIVFPLLDSMPLAPGRMRTPTQWAATTGRPLTLIHDMKLGGGVDLIEAFEADLILSVRFSYLFRRSTIRQASAGIINVHPGPLPQYRGLFTPFWQIMRGNDVLRCTVHLVDPGVDTGPVLTLAEVPVVPTRSLLWHMVQLYLTGAARAVTFINTGLPQAEPQDPALAGRTFAPSQGDFEQFRAKGFSLVNGADYLELLTPFIYPAVS